MKKHLVSLLLTSLLICTSFAVWGQDPPPPPPNNHGQSGNQNPGGSAPIGSGITLLITLAAAYGGKKVWDNRQRLTD